MTIFCEHCDRYLRVLEKCKCQEPATILGRPIFLEDGRQITNKMVDEWIIKGGDHATKDPNDDNKKT